MFGSVQKVPKLYKHLEMYIIYKKDYRGSGRRALGGADGTPGIYIDIYNTSRHSYIFVQKERNDSTRDPLVK